MYIVIHKFISILCYIFQGTIHQGTSRRKQFPLSIILAPTRELASQIYEESRKVRKKSFF